MNKAVAVLMTIGGVALAVTGAVALCGRDEEKQKQLGNFTKTKTSRGGMTLTHLSKRDLPLDQRVAILQDLTWKSVQDPRMRKLALGITRSCPERDGTCEAKAVYKAIKQRVRYTGDVGEIKMGAHGPVETIDLYQSAYRTWEFGGGDCDDHSVLAATLLTLNGIDSEFRIIAASRDPKENDWSHIYTTAKLPKGNPTKKVVIDTTLPGDHNFGREPPYGKRRDFIV